VASPSSSASLAPRSRGNSLTLDCFLPQTPRKTEPSLLPQPRSSDKCPWRTPETPPTSAPGPKPVASPSSLGSSSPSPSPSALSLHAIQKEEENVRQRSSIKALKGNTVPWLLDRKAALINSFEAVMESQAEELREQEELREALAAVARLEAKEKKDSSSGDQRNRRKKGRLEKR
jgi:hypothetical protein